MNLSPKELALSEAAQGHEEDLEKLRRIAHGIGLALGKCSINDVRRVWKGPIPTGWSGSIFRDKCWEKSGYEAALHDKAKGHTVAVWRFKGSRAGISSRKQASALGDAPAAPALGPQRDLFQGAA